MAAGSLADQSQDRLDADSGLEAQKISSRRESFASSKYSATCLNAPETGLVSLPSPTNDENEAEREWFEEYLFPRICAAEFLLIATNIRDGDHACHFGERIMGSLSVVFFLVFDDGVEWVVKIPKATIDDEEEHMFLMSEYTTHVFLQDIESIPAPKVHGASFVNNNPTKTPYFMMDKLPGIPLWRAVRENEMRRDGVFEMLRQLAEVRKVLATHTWPEIGSLIMVEEDVVVEKLLTD